MCLKFVQHWLYLAGICCLCLRERKSVVNLEALTTEKSYQHAHLFFFVNIFVALIIVTFNELGEAELQDDMDKNQVFHSALFLDAVIMQNELSFVKSIFLMLDPAKISFLHFFPIYIQWLYYQNDLY